MYIKGDVMKWAIYPLRYHELKERKMKPVKGEMMKKADLKTGMRLVLKNGDTCRVMLGTGTGNIVQYIDSEGAVSGFDRLEYWDKDLIFIAFFGGPHKDVVEVLDPRGFGADVYTSIWTRPVIHTIRLDDGAPVELSDKTYESMKRSFKFGE